MSAARRAATLALAAALLPVPVQAASPETETEHVVRDGETLNGIANRAKVTSKAIVAANGLKAPYAVRVGQTLKIPRATAAKTPARKTTPVKVPPPPSVNPKAAGSPEHETVHVVATGESLGSIATRAKVPRVLIAEANGLQPPYAVRVGQRLNIPRTRHYTVKAGDTGFAIAYKYGVPWRQIAVANGIDPGEAVKPGQELLIPTMIDPPVVAAAAAETAAKVAVAAASAPAGRQDARFSWPLEGTVRRGWKARNSSGFHDGLDIVAPHGAAVRAAAPGTVIFAGNEKEQFGNLVVVDHGDGWNTAYAFLSRVTVKKGARVASGERIGLVGDTGKAKGDELHFEVRQDGRPVDPRAELPDTP